MVLIYANSPYIADSEDPDETQRFTAKGIDINFLESGRLTAIMDVVSPLALCAFSLYTGVSMWRYALS